MSLASLRKALPTRPFVPLHLPSQQRTRLISQARSTTPITSNTPTTHFKITLRRSAIGLPAITRATLESMGLRRRMQTVFLPHTGQAAGKILKVKELVEVQNVAPEDVRTRSQARLERRPAKGYSILGNARGVTLGLD